MSESCDTIEVVSHMFVSRPAASVAAPPAVAEKLTDASKPQGRSTTAAGTSSASWKALRWRMDCFSRMVLFWILV